MLKRIALFFFVFSVRTFALSLVVLLSPTFVLATLISFEDKLTPDVVADKGFGAAVATDGGRLVIGSSPLVSEGIEEENPRERVYVFIRGETGWEFEQKLQPEDFSSEEGFGLAVAIDGNTIAVGAARKNDFAGAVYIFVKNGTAWELQQLLTPEDPEVDSFGYSVALSGNTLLVGAPGDDEAGVPFAGSASVFVRTDTSWELQEKLLPESSTDPGSFGWSVALDGNTAVMGAPFENDFVGSASVFVRSGTAWDQQQKLLSESPTDTPAFGWSVAVDADTTVIGTGGGNFASIFTRSGTTWTRQQRITGDDSDREGFGNAVAVLDEMVVIGIPRDLRGTTGFIGSAGVYVRSGTTWYFQQTLLSDVVDDVALFGNAVAISGDIILIGAPLDTIGGTFGLGSAWAFHIDEPVIKAEFESPVNGAVAGIALVRGWGYDSRAGETLSTVDLYVDGERETSIACCSERKDVQISSPDYPALNTLNSGWGLTFNWGNIPAGLHTVRVDLESTSGATLSTVERAINVVKLGDFPFLDQFDLSNAAVGIAGQELTLSGVQVRNKDTQVEKNVDATFQWMRAAQGFQLTDSTTLAQLTPPPSLLATWWKTLQHWFRGAALVPHAFANPDLMHAFESPANGPVSGITLVRGWAFETEASEGVESVELFIDGQLNTTIACCSERPDVQAAFPEFVNALNSGWGVTINWGDLSEGQHTVQVRIENTLGDSLLSDTRTVAVIKPGGFSFLDNLDISTATVSIEGQDVVLSGVVVEDAASEATATLTIRLRWSQASQTLELVEASPVG